MEEKKAEGNKVPEIYFTAVNGPVISIVQNVWLIIVIYFPACLSDFYNKARKLGSI